MAEDHPTSANESRPKRREGRGIEGERKIQAERIQQALADGEAAFAAKAFVYAKTRAAEVLEIAPENEAARSLLESATREQRRRDLGRSALLVGIGAAAAVVLAVTIWVRSDSTRGPTSQPSGTQASSGAPTQPVSGQGPSQGSRQPPPSTPDTPTPPQPSSGPTTPPPVQPAPATTVPDKPAADVAATNDARLTQLAGLRDTARQLYRKGQGVPALDTALRGLQIDATDSALRSILDSLLRDAELSARRAKNAATSAGAGLQTEPAFKEGVSLEEEAARSRAANRNDLAIRALWKAAERFQRAGEQAQARADQTRVAAKVADQARQKQIADDLARQKQIADEQLRQKQIADEQARQKQLADEAARKKETPTTVDPPPPSKPSPPLGDNRADEESRVRATLQRYEAAYDNLNAADVQRVYPSVPIDTVVRSFAAIRSYNLGIEIQKIEFSPDMKSATVSSRVTHDFRPKAGARAQDTRAQTFMLEKRGDTWIIVKMQIR